ncbi:acyltransferase family protein [Glacieibacterium sp.]|uniref:acyltransferase family protein n=1 Tax=Glacieibacterium sp. TaxID=2860237 RepID=UPI003B003ED2
MGQKAIFAIAGELRADRADALTSPRPQRSKEEFNVAAHGLRGLASVMVLMAHIIGGTARHIYPDDLSYVLATRHPWYLGTFGVQLFFVISGFVIVPSALKYRPGDFALRRFLRIYPLFFVLSLFFIAINAMTNSYPKINNLGAIVSGLLFTNLFTGTEQLTPNAWSLTFEVVFYVLTCAIMHFTIRHKIPLLSGIAIVAAAVFAMYFPIAVYFMVGVLVRYLYPAAPLSRGLQRGLECCCFFALIWLASRAHFEYHWTDFQDPVVIPLILVTGCFFYLAVAPGSATNAIMDNRVARYVGTISYSLYLVHPYIYFGVRTAFSHLKWFGPDIARSMTLFGAVVVVLSFVVSHFVHLTLERAPYAWYFRQRIYRDAGDGKQANT